MRSAADIRGETDITEKGSLIDIGLPFCIRLSGKFLGKYFVKFQKNTPTNRIYACEHNSEQGKERDYARRSIFKQHITF